MKTRMFYRAGPLIFERAKELRKNMTDAEMTLWGWLKTKPRGFKFRRQHPLGIYIGNIKIIRFTNEEVMKQFERVIEIIASFLFNNKLKFKGA